MAASFSCSSEWNQWMKTMSEEQLQQKLYENDIILSKEEIDKVVFNCTGILVEMGSRNDIDRRIINTAIIYFRRLYYKLHFNQIHPYLAVVTCFYLASKVEEIAMTASRSQSYFVTVCKNHSIEPLQWTVEDIMKCECVILDQLDYSLIVFQPFRSLRHFINVFHLDDYIQPCTSIVNDCFFTSIPLIYPPHLIALTSIYMICIFNNINPAETFSKMNIDMTQIHKICSKICEFYDNGIDLWPTSITDCIIVLTQQFK